MRSSKLVISERHGFQYALRVAEAERRGSGHGCTLTGLYEQRSSEHTFGCYASPGTERLAVALREVVSPGESSLRSGRHGARAAGASPYP